MKVSLPAAALAVLSLLVKSTSAVGCFEKARHFHPDDWTFCQPITEGIFMYYTPFEDEGNVMIGLHVADDSFGWSSLALSGNGGMKGAAQIVVRLDEDNGWVAEDRYSEGYVTPSMDEQQDVKLLFANQTADGETSWGVLLPMNPCDDPNNYPIQDKKVYMLWALGEDHTFSFHGARRGQFHVNLMQAPTENPTTDGLTFLDIQMPNVPVVLGEGGTDATNPYICSVFDLEELSEGRFGSGEKIHITRFSPILEESHYVHHMILYSCSGDQDDFTHLQVEPECESMPRGCNEMKWSWALGGGDTVLPPDVGMPLAEEQRFAVLQMHYFNPNLDEEVTDNSGIRAYFTTDLREQEAGVMQLVGGVSGWQRAPLSPGVADLELSPLIVPHDCTATRWTGPLNILAVGHHMHLLGTKMDITIERDGANLGSLRSEHHYDFNHQALMEPNPALRTLLPGDQLITKCQYDTSKAAEEISFGDLTQQEMCYAPIYYFPKQSADMFTYTAPNANITRCLSPATEEPFLSQNASLCAQVLFDHVPRALGFEKRVPLAFGLLEACNGGELYSTLLRQVDGICPSCNEDASCTEEEIVEHSTTFCSDYCQSSLDVSLYPDLSKTVPFDSGVFGCPGRYFHSPELLEPVQCEEAGNLSQVIQLQPVMSSGPIRQASFAAAFGVILAMVALL